MPDITLCDNYECPLRERCYRYRAIPSEFWQSFAHFETKTVGIIGGMATQCDRFISVTGYESRLIPTKDVDKRYKREVSE